MKCTFANVLEIKNGRNQKAVENPNGGYPIYGSGGVMGRANDFICRANTVIIGRKGNINKPIYVEEPFWNVDTAFGLEANPQMLLPKYLYYFCLRYDFEKLNKAVTIPSLTKVDLLKIEMILPELSVQAGIIDKLEKIEEVISLYRQELQRFDDLIKARFVEMFGDPEGGTCHFRLERLGDLSTKISDGVHAKPDYTESGRPFLSVVNINKGLVDFTDCKYVSEEAYQKMIKSTHPEKGDVLYTKVGATYGIPTYVDTEREFCLYVSVCLIKPVHENINARFLAIQMAMPFVKHQADSRIKGIGVPDLHLNQISEFKIVCPPRELQDEFVSFVEQVDKSKAVVQQALAKDQLLFDSLMQQYFG